MINLLDGFREGIDWIDCSPSTGLSSGQSSHSGISDCSGGFSCQFSLYQKSLVRSFFLPFIWHAFITNYIVVITGASSLCRTLDYIPYKNKKLFVRSCFTVPGLSFNDKAINRHKILQNLLTRGSLSKVIFIIIWHDVINKSISPHRSNNYQPSSIDQLKENLLLFKDRIKAIVYCRRLGTGDIKRRLFGSQIIIIDAVRKLISHKKSKDSTILSHMRQVHPSAALEFKLLSVVWNHRNHVQRQINRLRRNRIRE